MNRFKRKRYRMPVRAFSLFLSLIFVAGSLILPGASYGQSIKSSVMDLPAPGTMLKLSESYAPFIMRGLTLDPANPLQMDFIIDTGQTRLEGEALNKEARKLIKYFLATLTVPENELWVNLSPYEEDRIIAKGLSETEMGRDLLAQDYLLKQLSASILYPEEDLGQRFWDKVYRKSQEEFGSTDIPVNTFNKIWIVPDKAVVYTNGAQAFIIESHLKVMLEEDYVALQNNIGSQEFGLKNTSPDSAEAISDVSSKVVREIVVPAIEEEVNTGKTFANLRQIYNSMILGAWYKINLRESLLGKVYMDKNKVKGVDVEDKEIKEKIYRQYLEAFRKGVYDYIREDEDPVTHQPIPRKYYSGGFGSQTFFPDIRAQEIRGEFDRLTPPQRQRVVRGTQTSHRNAAMLAVTAGFQDIGRQADTSVVDEISRGEITAPGPIRFESVRKDPASANKAMLSFEYSGPEDNERIIREIEELRGAEKLEQMHILQALFEAAKTVAELKIVTFPTTTLRVEVDDSVATESYKRKWDDNTIKITLPFLKRIMEKGRAEPVTRQFIYMYTQGTVLDKKKAEYSFAKKHYPDVVNNLLPHKGVTIEDVMANIERNILPLNLNTRQLQKDLGVDWDIQDARDEKSLFLANELRETAEVALYRIATHALNGKIDLNYRTRLSSQDAPFAGTETVRVGMLAFAANPMQQAHLVVTMLKAMAETEVDSFFAAPTFGDFRKPKLRVSYEDRERITREFVERISGGLIRVMPKLPHDNGFNGEDKVLDILELNERAASVSLFYGAGSDHFYSFARYSRTDEHAAKAVGKPGVRAGHVKFATIITEGNKRNYDDFLYYVDKDGYKMLLAKLLQDEPGSLTPEQRQFIRKLRDHPAPKKLLKAGAEFPVLDVIGKLFIIQQEVDSSKMTVSMIHNVRPDELYPDKLRESLGVPIVEVQGVKTDISASEVREEIPNMVRDKVVRIDSLRGLPKDLLAEMLKPNERSRGYLYYLIRLTGLMAAKSLTVMFPMNTEAEEKRQQELRSRLQAMVDDVKPGLIVHESEAGEESVITVQDSAGAVLVDYRYSVEEGLNDEDASPLTSLIVRNVIYADGDNKALAHKIEGSITTFARDLNQVNAIQDLTSEGDDTIIGPPAPSRAMLTAETDLVKSIKERMVSLIAGIPELAEVGENVTLGQLGDNGGIIKLVAAVEREWGIFVDDASRDSVSLEGFYKVVLRELTRTTVRQARQASLLEDQPPGGIDLNPQLLDLQIKRDESGVPLPVYDQPFESMQIEGFLPVIINVTPVSLPLLLGSIEEETDTPAQLSSL